MDRRASLAERRSRLSPGQRALLENRLQGALIRDTKLGGIPRRPRLDVYPLSFAQERLWFLNQLEPGNPAYNRPLALRLSGRLDISGLRRALDEILCRHEVLRAIFCRVDGSPFQAITPCRPLAMPVTDLDAHDSSHGEARARLLAREEAQRPFDLERGPLVRAHLLRLDPADHVLILVFHHIVFDRWSATVLINELTTLYEAHVNGNPSPLPAPRIPYADYAHWQVERFADDALDVHLAYWSKQLAGLSPLNLPTDRPRPAVRTHRGGCERLVLPSSLLQRLKDLSGEENVTLFMTLVGAFAVLLHRYASQDDIAVGIPVAGRTHVDTESLIGLFLNTLVLRNDLSGNPSFRELMGRIRETALAAYAHQDLPFERVVQVLQPERDLSRAPLFQVMFNLESIPGKAARPATLRIDEFVFESGVSQFDLALELVEQGDEMFCLMTYSADLFDAATIARMLGHYRTLLEGILSDPDERIGYLPLLTERERHKMLVEWNATESEFPDDLCVHHLFEAQVERTPDAVAVRFKDRQLTYRELNTQANRLAHCLRSRGVGPEVLVGMCMEHCLEAVVAILGILKAGGAYVPLDPAYPLERLRYMIADSGGKLVVTLSSLAERVVSAGAPDWLVLDLGDISPEMAGQPSNNPHPEGLGPDNLAYVIYTSGTTGRPKGVPVQHAGVVNVVWYRVTKLFDKETLSESLLQSSLSFDASVVHLFMPLAAGGVVHIAADLLLVERLLNNGALTWFELTPSSLEALLADIGLLGYGATLSVGGEQVSQQLVDRIRTHSCVSRMINIYGPTEATIAATDSVLIDRAPRGSKPRGNGAEENRRRRVTVGRPMWNVRVYILDRYLKPTPVGVPGELHIAGVGLARGYLHSPGMTAERFIPNPFCAHPGERLYKTGDEAQYLPDGRIELRGRTDRQVKVRGFRIELGAIESILERHPGVRQAVAVTWETDPGGALGEMYDGRLVAYVVPKDDGSSVHELRRHVSQRLPRWMIPSHFVFLDELPLTPHGKVDRRGLPAPQVARAEVGTAIVAPRTRDEHQLAQIWADVLKLEQVGVHDNFFDLGGHSLLASRVVSRIRSVTGLDVPLRVIFETPSVAGLVQSLETIRWATRGPQPPADGVQFDEGQL